METEIEYLKAVRDEKRHEEERLKYNIYISLETQDFKEKH